MTDQKKHKLDFITISCPVMEQIGIAQEECAELIQALSKFRRYGTDALDQVAEEMADVSICLEELKLYFDNRFEVDEWMDKKLDRSVNRILKNGREAE